MISKALLVVRVIRLWILFGLVTWVSNIWLENSSAAGERFQDKRLALDLVGGSPHLLGFDLTLMGNSTFQPGLSLGTVPIQNVINEKVNLSPMPVSLSLPDTYQLYPKLGAAMGSWSAFLKVFPWSNSGFLFNFLFSVWNLSGRLNVDLKNETSGAVSSSAFSGTANVTQAMMGLAVGYQLQLFSTCYVEFALGASYPFKPSSSISFGGTASSVIGILPNGEASFDSARDQIRDSLNSALDLYQSSIRVIPIAYLNIGFAF